MTQSTNTTPPSPSPAEVRALERMHRVHGLARLVLAAFLFTFLISRILVILIMLGKLPPQLFFHVKGVHVHHLNYGIILLSLMGAYSIFAGPTGKRLSAAAIVYGIGLALTFDEFGMWLHLGGLYWQRASFDAIITIGALLALLTFATTLRRWHARHGLTIILLIVVLTAFGILWHKSMDWAHERLGPALYHLETNGPTDAPTTTPSSRLPARESDDANHRGTETQRISQRLFVVVTKYQLPITNYHLRASSVPLCLCG